MHMCICDNLPLMASDKTKLNVAKNCLKNEWYCVWNLGSIKNNYESETQLTRAETKEALDTLAFLSTIACFR